MSFINGLISEGEKTFLRTALSSKRLRLDLRHTTQYRPIHIEYDPIAQTSGSARIQFGPNVEILVAIKADIITPELAYPDKGVAIVSVESSSSTIGEDKSNYEALMVSLSSRLRSLIKDDLLKELCIEKGKYAWKLFIDCLIFSSDGAQYGIDAISLGMRAALSRCSLPSIIIEGSGESCKLSLDPEHPRTLSIASVPLLITLCIIKGVIIVDPRVDEELCSNAIISVGVDKGGRLCSIYTCQGHLFASTLLEIISIAQATAANIFGTMK